MFYFEIKIICSFYNVENIVNIKILKYINCAMKSEDKLSFIKESIIIKLMQCP